MYEIVVDRSVELESVPYTTGAVFYFETLKEVVDFIDLCFKTNDNREYIEIREVKEEE